ncbi:MAG: septum site-determining protein MinD, partial [Alistipes sp.]|nr:septum site-determining protein MinD [Alistipes sp.]
LIKDKRHTGLYLMPAAQTRDKNCITPGQMIKLIDSLREQFDYIILDCPAGIEQGFQNAIAGADRAVIVTTPEVSSVRDADRIIGLLDANEIHRQHLIINKIRMDMVKKGDMMSIEDVVEILACDLIGIVPDDEHIVISTNQGELVVGSGVPAGCAYMNISRRICGEDVPFMELSGKNHIWNKISKIFMK